MPMTDEERLAALDTLDAEASLLRRRIAELRADLRDAIIPPVATAELRREATATPDSFAEGDWVRHPGSQVWRQVDQVIRCSAHGEACRHVHWRAGDPTLMDAATAYPYLTDAQFQADCDAEQRAMEVTDLHQQRAKDFGHDDPAAA
jgi:hypothetical protein